MTLDTSTEKCCVCGEEFPVDALEPIFTGRRHYMCASCQGKCAKEVIGHRASYFSSYQGKKRLEFGDRKKRRN